MTFFHGFWNERRGASSSEYALLLALICIAIIAGGQRLGTTVNDRLSAAGTRISNAS
ncbi:Flp family type IVb pilin [Sandarakinorhabdus sp. DWP1-3-1]|uniref:Flp family type IVb pilin n=1 Tax=Sandarakinorhabdus sp. DWP1-3-1 TaxID=2804627 RepID=UPI003CE8EDBB